MPVNRTIIDANQYAVDAFIGPERSEQNMLTSPIAGIYKVQYIFFIVFFLFIWHLAPGTAYRAHLHNGYLEHGLPLQVPPATDSG